MLLTKNKCFLLGILFGILLWLVIPRNEVTTTITSFLKA